MGLYLGRWYLFGPSIGERKTLRIGYHWSKRAWSKTVFSNRRRHEKVHSELEKGSTEAQKPWHEYSSVGYW